MCLNKMGKDMDLELPKFVSGSGINHYGSKTLVYLTLQILKLDPDPQGEKQLDPEPQKKIADPQAWPGQYFTF